MTLSFTRSDWRDPTRREGVHVMIYFRRFIYCIMYVSCIMLVYIFISYIYIYIYIYIYMFIYCCVNSIAFNVLTLTQK